MKLTKNFDIAEFKCHDQTGVPWDLVANVTELAKNLQVLRDELGLPINVVSGYRNPTYNKLVVKGAKESQHMEAKAADIKIKGKTPGQVHALIEKLIADGKMKEGGLGLYKTWIHYDTRGTHARWNG